MNVPTHISDKELFEKNQCLIHKGTQLGSIFYIPNFLLIAVLFYNVNRKDAMMHKPILDDRKKEFRGLTIHKMV